METQDIRNAFYDTLEYLRSSEMQGVLIRTRKNTLLYPDNFCTWHHRPLCSGEVTVVDRTPVETCVKYGKDAKTAVLMTGDPQNPGESARKGIADCESELCICTSVYPCLSSTEQGEAFYTMNARVNPNTYTDRVLYVREVPVIKTKSGKVIPFDKRVNVDIMVIAVPKGNDATLLNIYKNRIKNAMDVAIEEGVKIIILDAFNTQNKEAKVLAKAYAETIQEGHYTDQFEKIIFAIPEYETRMIFASTFGTQEVIPSITPQVKREPEVVEMPSPMAIRNEYVVKEPEVVPMPAPVTPEPVIEEVTEPVKVEEPTPVEPEVVVKEEVKPIVEEAVTPVVEEVVETVTEVTAEPEPVVEETKVEEEQAPVEITSEPAVKETMAAALVEEVKTEESVKEVPAEPEAIVEEVTAPAVEEKTVEPEVEEVVEEPVEVKPEPAAPVVEGTPVEKEPEPVITEEPKVEPVIEEVKAVEPEVVVKEELKPIVEEVSPVEEKPAVVTTPEPEVLEVEETVEPEPVVREAAPAVEQVKEVIPEPVVKEEPEVVEAPVVEEKQEQIVTEENVAKEPEHVAEPVIEEVKAVEPEVVVKEELKPIVEEVVAPVEEPKPVETPAVEETVEPVKVEEPTPVEEVVTEEPVTEVSVEPEPVVEEVNPEPVVEPAPSIAREMKPEEPVYRYTVREEQESVPAEPIPVVEEMPSVKKDSPTEQLDDGVVDLGSLFVEEKKDDVLSRCVKTKSIRESRAFTSYEAELDGKDVVVTIYGFEPSQAAMSDMLYDRFEKLGNIHSPMVTAYPCVERNGDELVVIAEKEPDGMPLEKLAGKLSNERALHYMQQVAEGMKLLHEHGLPVNVVSPSFFKVTMTGNIHFIAGRIRTMKDAPVLDEDQKFMMPGFVDDEVRASLYAIGAMTYYLLNGTLYSEEGVREHIAADPENSAVYRMIYFCCTDIEQIRIKDYESLVNEITNNR